MYAEISAAISSVKAAAEIAKAANNLANFNEVVTALSEVNTKLLEATAVALASQEKQAELISRVAALEKELSEIKSVQSARERYTLQTLSSGALVYGLIKEKANGEPHHYVCTHCMDRGFPQRLQPVQQGTFLFYVCHSCSARVKA